MFCSIDPVLLVVPLKPHRYTNCITQCSRYRGSGAFRRSSSPKFIRNVRLVGSFSASPSSATIAAVFPKTAPGMANPRPAHFSRKQPPPLRTTSGKFPQNCRWDESGCCPKGSCPKGSNTKAAKGELRVRGCGRRGGWDGERWKSWGRRHPSHWNFCGNLARRLRLASGIPWRIPTDSGFSPGEEGENSA